jgi:hypothetical protein
MPYRSLCQPVGMAHVSGPGSGDPFDPWDLDDVRERVVRPVLGSLIRPPDLERLDVGWGPREPGPPWPRSEDELWLLVTAAGETWHSSLWQVELAEQLETLGQVAWTLADQLEDWVAEAVYWGEHAVADVVIPPRRP